MKLRSGGMVDIILSAMSSQVDEAEVGGDGAVVSRGRRRIVGEGFGEVVGEFAGSHEHVAGLIRSVQCLALLGLCLGLLLSVGDTHKVPEGEEPHGVAGSAHLLVHLVSPANRGMV